MRSIASNRVHAARTEAAQDAGTHGFILWITVYTVFMLALIAFNGGTRLFGPIG